MLDAHFPLRVAVVGHAMVDAAWAPVVCPQNGGVVLAGGLVEDGKQLVGLTGQHLQVHYCVGAVALHWGDHQVTVEVPGVEARYGQAVAVAGQGCRVLPWSRWLGRRRIHVVEENVSQRARYPTSLIGNLQTQKRTPVSSERLKEMELPLP